LLGDAWGTLPLFRLDLSVGSDLFGAADVAATPERFDELIRRDVAPDAIGVGGYGEARLLYTTPEFAPADAADEARTVHLGVDVWTVAGTPLHTPHGTVHWYDKRGWITDRSWSRARPTTGSCSTAHATRAGDARPRARGRSSPPARCRLDRGAAAQRRLGAARIQVISTCWGSASTTRVSRLAQRAPGWAVAGSCSAAGLPVGGGGRSGRRRESGRPCSAARAEPVGVLRRAAADRPRGRRPPYDDLAHVLDW
jgi:hypothetical protein